MTNYTFSVVATNSIGSGEAGVVINITATSSMGVNSTLRPATLTIVAATSTCSISTTNTTAKPSYQVQRCYSCYIKYQVQLSPLLHQV